MTKFKDEENGKHLFLLSFSRRDLEELSKMLKSRELSKKIIFQYLKDSDKNKITFQKTRGEQE